MLGLKEPIEFEWDSANIMKSQVKHSVTHQEAEEVFINKRSLIFPAKYAGSDKIRWTVFGKTNNARPLTVVFTIREERVRIISARTMSKKERSIYEKAADSARIQE